LDLAKYIEKVVDRFDRLELHYGHGTENSFDEAVYLVYGVLGIDYQISIDVANRILTSDEFSKLDEKVEIRISQRIPVAYLLNEAWFAGIKFLSDARALVPRSPIAELIQNNFQSLLMNKPNSVLDLCCGGGCIGIATAKYFESAQVDLADFDPDALDLALSNINLHDVESRVKVIQSDLFSAIYSNYDLILCNPPYVSAQEYKSLPDEFKQEPVIGLVCEEDGLALSVRILKEAANYLADEGMLIMEVGYSAKLLAQRFESVPFLWLDFDHGGSGVLALSQRQLQQFSEEFN